MKLTKRGKDFLVAALAGTITASVLDIKIVLALCFSLVIVALISEVILSRTLDGNIEITPSTSRVSCFKEDEVGASLMIRSRRPRLVSVSLAKVIPPRGVEAELEESAADTLGLRIRPKFAGRFSGLAAQFELKDPIQLFSKTIEFSAAHFIIDSQPISLLKDIRAARPVSIALGEREGTTHGIGLEFYSLDDYHGSTERKNIFWKKVASMPDERLLVKLRESNIPRSLSVALLHTSDRRQDSLAWIDSACEGVASIGKVILQIGCDVEVLFDSGAEVLTRQASSISELSDAVMEMSTSRLSDLDNASLLLTKADICVTGFRELENGLLASAVAKKPALLIEDKDAVPNKIGELAVIYSPEHDLGALVNRVVGI